MYQAAGMGIDEVEWTFDVCKSMVGAIQKKKIAKSDTDLWFS